MSNIFEALKKSDDTLGIAGQIEGDSCEDGQSSRVSSLSYLVNSWTVDHTTCVTDETRNERTVAEAVSKEPLLDGLRVDGTEVEGQRKRSGGETHPTVFSIPKIDDISSESSDVDTEPLDARVFPFLTDLHAPSAEQYRILRTNLLQHPVQPKVIAVSSASPGDGKTLTAVNIGGILAMKSDVRVLLIDADMRHCSVATMLGLKSSLGFADVLRGACLWEQAVIQSDKLANLHVLIAGQAFDEPVELLDSDNCRAVMAELRKKYSFVIVDTPPMAAVADFKLVLGVSDGALIVVRPDHTERAGFLNSLNIDPPQKLLGVVVNAYSDWVLWKTPDAYSYYGGRPSEKGRFMARLRENSPW